MKSLGLPLKHLKIKKTRNTEVGVTRCGFRDANCSTFAVGAPPRTPLRELTALAPPDRQLD